jgi:nucleotide-binding universal stress UspA family protein
MRVLYATDGRPPAVAAGALLAAIADPRRAQVTVLHVDEYGNEAVAEQAARAAFASALERLGAAGIQAETKRVGDGVKHAILRELEETEYGLVAIGAGNTGWLGRLILGGVSTYVMHRSTAPTLVVHRRPVEGRDRVRVVVGTDGSSAAKRAMDTLIAFARPERCDVFVRSVVEPPAMAAPGLPELAAVPPDAFDRVIHEQTRDANRAVDAAVSGFADAGFACEGDVAMGPAEVALLDAVRDRDADLVVVGSRGLGRFAEMTLGSVSSHVVRTAPATLVAHDPGEPQRSASSAEG